MTEKLTLTEKPATSHSIFGRIGLRRSAEIKRVSERTPLPKGFHYAKPWIHPSEEAELKQKVEIGKDTDERGLHGRDITYKNAGVETFKVGVRNRMGGLVGFGTIAYKGDVGELGNFVVDPSVQGKGIGKAIIDERLRLAEQAGVTSLYMPDLEPTNTLESYYIEKGFHIAPEGELVRGPHPVSVVQGAFAYTDSP